MKAIILLATLKKRGLSNTETLCEFLSERLRRKSIETETIKLVEHAILAGTYSNMGTGDAWPEILKKIIASDIIIFATPIWWNNYSSELQKVIERLDEIHDEILRGDRSRLEGKVGGVVITGDGDGAQHIIGSVANFFNAIGMVFPPYATLSVLSPLQAKGITTSRDELFRLYEKDYAKAANTMVEELCRYSAS